MIPKMPSLRLDRIAILQGRLQQVDIPRILYEIPANGYVANFFGKMNFMPGRPTDDGFYTPFGFLQCEQAKGKDHKYHIRFRPEHAFILDNSPDHLQGQIEKVAYLGDHQLLRVALYGSRRKTCLCICQNHSG